MAPRRQCEFGHDLKRYSYSSGVVLYCPVCVRVRRAACRRSLKQIAKEYIPLEERQRAQMIPITETYGDCRTCQRIAILGNGLCVQCWDRQANRLSDQLQL